MDLRNHSASAIALSRETLESLGCWRSGTFLFSHWLVFSLLTIDAVVRICDLPRDRADRRRKAARSRSRIERIARALTLWPAWVT